MRHYKGLYRRLAITCRVCALLVLLYWFVGVGLEWAAIYALHRNAQAVLRYSSLLWDMLGRPVGVDGFLGINDSHHLPWAYIYVQPLVATMLAICVCYCIVTWRRHMTSGRMASLFTVIGQSWILGASILSVIVEFENSYWTSEIEGYGRMPNAYGMVCAGSVFVCVCAGMSIYWHRQRKDVRMQTLAAPMRFVVWVFSLVALSWAVGLLAYRSTATGGQLRVLLLLWLCMAVEAWFAARLRQLSNDNALACPMCGYDIRYCGLKCSECGTELRPPL